MPLMIVMTEEQAAAVAGEVAPGRYLEPRPLADGRYALSVSILDAALYAAAHPTLAGYPVEDVDPADDFQE